MPVSRAVLREEVARASGEGPLGGEEGECE